MCDLIEPGEGTQTDDQVAAAQMSWSNTPHHNAHENETLPVEWHVMVGTRQPD